MIRRNVREFERDQWVVRWTLLAAVLALLVGYFAQMSLHRHAAEAVPTAGQHVEVDAPAVAGQPAKAPAKRTAAVTVTG